MTEAALAKTRIQIDLSPTEVARMNWMMEVCDIATRKDLFNNALTVLEWMVKEVGSGKKIAAFNDETRDRHILSMPALNSAALRSADFVAERKPPPAVIHHDSDIAAINRAMFSEGRKVS